MCIFLLFYLEKMVNVYTQDTSGLIYYKMEDTYMP